MSVHLSPCFCTCGPLAGPGSYCSRLIMAFLPFTIFASCGAQWRAQSSAHGFLHERGDLCLFGGGQLPQRVGGRPHGAFVEVCLVAEAECRVPRVELLRALEEADDLAVLGIPGHSGPGL